MICPICNEEFPAHYNEEDIHGEMSFTNLEHSHKSTNSHYIYCSYSNTHFHLKILFPKPLPKRFKPDPNSPIAAIIKAYQTLTDNGFNIHSSNGTTSTLVQNYFILSRDPLTNDPHIVPNFLIDEVEVDYPTTIPTIDNLQEFINQVYLHYLNIRPKITKLNHFI